MIEFAFLCIIAKDPISPRKEKGYNSFVIEAASLCAVADWQLYKYAEYFRGETNEAKPS